MFCTKCGNKLPENVKFCPKCGAGIKAAVLNESKISKSNGNKGKVLIIGVIAAVALLSLFVLINVALVIATVMPVPVLTDLLACRCLIHHWQDATYTSPETCSVCGKTRGGVIPHVHDWQEKDCVTQKHCRLCGEYSTDTSLALHEYNGDGACGVCGVTMVELTMDNIDNYMKLTWSVEEDTIYGEGNLIRSDCGDKRTDKGERKDSEEGDWYNITLTSLSSRYTFQEGGAVIEVTSITKKYPMFISSGGPCAFAPDKSGVWFCEVGLKKSGKATNFEIVDAQGYCIIN